MEWIPSPNFSEGRDNNSIKYIIIHWFGVGTIDCAISSFQNPDRQASAHYLISDNRLVKMVEEENTAWHCGVFSVNQESIGIEHDANPEKELSEESYQTSGKLVKEICDRYGIPLDREHIKGHNEIVPTQCPGTIDIDRIIEIAKGEYMTEEQDLDFCIKQREPMWRNTHPGEKMDEGYFKSECSGVLKDYKAGEEWAGAGLTDEWVKHLIESYETKIKDKEELLKGYIEIISKTESDLQEAKTNLKKCESNIESNKSFSLKDATSNELIKELIGRIGELLKGAKKD